MTDSPYPILENSFRIAWDYLEGTGELGERQAAARFLLDSIETAMRQGEGRKLLLANRAIDAYRRSHAGRDLALVS